MTRLNVFSAPSADHFLQSLNLAKLTPDLKVIHSHLIDPFQRLLIDNIAWVNLPSLSLITLHNLPVVLWCLAISIREKVGCLRLSLVS